MTKQTPDSDLRAQLLALQESDEEMQLPLLQEAEARFEKQRSRTRWIWVYLVLISTLFLVISGYKSHTTQGVWFGVLACFWMGFGSIFLNQMWHTRNRLELRREIARLDLTLQTLLERLEEK